MSLYDGLKDVISIAQKADNVELYRQLLDLSAEALDMQNQINILTKENHELKNELSKEKSIQRHIDGNYITLKDDDLQIKYCATCWGSERKLIQLRKDIDKNSHHSCPVCQNNWLKARNSGK